jgi:hypothetical protein
MDYLDPVKQTRNRITLFIGYILVAIAAAIAALVLLNQAYGFGLGKNGQLIQHGLVYFSSQPSPASIYINGQLKGNTNTRLYLPEDIYNVSLYRSGYYTWQRRIELDGGSVTYYTYPFLLPKTLTTSKIASYTSAPALMTQSPNRRWLLISKAGSLSDFDLYDLKNPTNPPTPISLPSDILTKSTDPETLQLVAWSDDNQYVLLEHTYGSKTEYILVDRSDPSQSINLNNEFGVNPDKLELINDKYNQYYAYDSIAQTVQQLTLGSQAKTIVAAHVLAFESYGTNTLLYFTDKAAPTGDALLKMQVGTNVYILHSFPLSTSYELNLTQYNGTMYVAASADNSGKVFIYKDPVGQLSQSGIKVASPIQVLNVPDPNYLSFSDNAQFIVAENGSHFGVYDIENQKGYSYQAAVPDAPQLHASWMDGDRLTYVSNGKLIVFDYDHTNQHILVSAASQYLPVFDSNFKYLYTINQNATDGQYDLNQTSLLAPADR